MVKNFGLDRMLLVVALLLLGIGLLMVYSTSIIVAKENYGDGYFFMKKQLQWMVLGLLVFFSVIFMERPLYLNPKIVSIVFLLVLLALLAVFFSVRINNTYRWIRMAGFSIQPSEFAKIAVVLYLAMALSRKGTDINQLRHLLVALFPVAVALGLILKEPDFGTFILILVVTLIMLFIAGLRLRYFALFFTLFLPFIYVLIKIDPERTKRLLSFLNPEMYSSTSGFQSLQSLWAIGSGGLFGQGIGNSTQKLFFLPYAYTDFIFAIIAEEFGLIGSLIVMGLFMLFFVRGIQIARHAENPHIYLLVSGLTFMVAVQALINISVAVSIFPTKGMPLPFVSSGGTSLLCTLLVTGIILNVSRHRKMVFAND